MNDLMLKGLQDMLDQLETGKLSPAQERDTIEREALKHKQSISELAEENAELKRRLWEYENCYRAGKLPMSG
tara:strand:+ start:407 stop:622 length:216 start_codon:yes stop_codon:yes gene_type:complete